MWRLTLRLLASSSSRYLSRLSGRPAPAKRTAMRLTLLSTGAGVLAGTGYSVFTHYRVNSKSPLPPAESLSYPLLHQPPDYTPHCKVEGDGRQTASELELVLFQYGTCPFCCKVRAYLDARGIPYQLVEVDAVLRQAIAWSKYKKVPIILAKVNGGYQQLYDSTAIISILETVVREEGAGAGDACSRLQRALAYYPLRPLDNAHHGDVLNKYFVMSHDNHPHADKTAEIEERKWRQWADEHLVHVLSPNVYRSASEARHTFLWFADVAHWRQLFPAWEVALMVNVGAVAMWLISKRLKARHKLEDDVRASLYAAGEAWCAAVRARDGPFHGGGAPDLADLAVFGVLSSIEGCAAFADLRAHVDISRWYDAVAERVRGPAAASAPAPAAALLTAL